MLLSECKPRALQSLVCACVVTLEYLCVLFRTINPDPYMCANYMSFSG